MVATVTQLAAVLGVASFGTVYLSLAPSQSAITDAALLATAALTLPRHSR